MSAPRKVLSAQPMAVDYLFETFDVDVDALMAGETVWAQNTRIWIQKIRGDASVLVIDGEGTDGLFYEVGVAEKTAKGDMKKVMNLTNRGLGKTFDTKRKNRYRFQPPPLSVTQRAALKEHVAKLIERSSSDDVLAFHYGGAEKKWLRELGIPTEHFADALKFIRYILGAKLNGQFPADSPYGYQMSTARARAKRHLQTSVTCGVPFAGPLLLHLHLLRLHPDAHRPRRLRVHDQAPPRDGRRPGAPPRRQEQEDARHVQGAQLGVGARRQGGAAGARDLPRQRQLEEVVAAIALDVDLILFCNPWRARCRSSRAPYSLRAFLGSAGR